MNNIPVKSKKQKTNAILRYENDNYLCPSGHVVTKVGNDFKCQKCNDVFKRV